MNAKRILVSSAAIAMLVGCSAAPTESATASNEELIIRPPPLCLAAPSPQWWDYSINTDPNARWFDLSVYDSAKNPPWVDSVGTAWHPFIGLDQQSGAPTDVVWVAAPNTEYFACVNTTCDIHAENGINGQPPASDPGGGTRHTPNCGGGTCPYRVPNPPSICLEAWFLSEANDPLASQQAEMCSNTAACIAQATKFTPVGGGSGSGSHPY